MRANLLLIATAAAALSLPSAALAQDAAAPPSEGEASATSSAGSISAATEADVTTGKTVYDKNGEVVGTVESASAAGAVVKTDSARVQIPIAGFGKNASGLVLGMTKADVDSAAQANAPEATADAPAADAPAETPPQQ